MVNGAAAGAKEETLRVVGFSLDQQEYAVPIEKLREVVPIVRITRVFHTPPFVIGVVNLRGNIIAILDIRPFFDLPPGKIMPASRLMILHAAGKTAGILVDSVSKVKDIGRSAIVSSLPTIKGKTAKFMGGVHQAEDHPIIILDVEKLMESEEVRSLAGETPSATP